MITASLVSFSTHNGSEFKCLFKNITVAEDDARPSILDALLLSLKPIDRFFKHFRAWLYNKTISSFYIIHIYRQFLTHIF